MPRQSAEPVFYQCKSLWGKPLFGGPERPENHPVDDFQRRPGGSPGQRAVSPFPHPQWAQVRFMRTLLVSDDLTADLISATGGNRRFVPFRESHKRNWKKLFDLLPFFLEKLSHGLGTHFPTKICIEPIKNQTVTVMTERGSHGGDFYANLFSPRFRGLILFKFAP